ncbi:MAG: hypothetical protein WAR79_00175 [Melioribacteraceae bacterium]
MKKNNNINGFTIIEIIVGINISFILLTVLITFFLFASKFVSSTTKNLDERQNTNEFFLKFESTLNRADHFYFEKIDDSYLCVVDDYDTIIINQDSCSLRKLFSIKNINDYNIVFNMQDGIIIKIKNGKVDDFKMSDKDNNITSQDILELTIDIIKNHNSYRFYYINPNISINRLRNITI